MYLRTRIHGRNPQRKAWEPSRANSSLSLSLLASLELARAPRSAYIIVRGIIAAAIHQVETPLRAQSLQAPCKRPKDFLAHQQLDLPRRGQDTLLRNGISARTALKPVCLRRTVFASAPTVCQRPHASNLVID